MQCTFVSCQEQLVDLQIDPQYIDLLNDSHQQRIVDALTEYFSQAIKVKIVAGQSEFETPIACQNRRRDEKLQAAREALEQDPVVQELMNRFDAVLDVESIEPKD